MHGFDSAGGRVGAANVPSEYRMVTLQNSPARADQAAAYALIDKYAATFPRQFDPEEDRIKSYYLFSRSPGTGKTTSAAALINEYLTCHYIGSVKRGLKPLERPAYFLDVNTWQSLYTEFNRPKVPDDIAGPASRLYYAQMQAAKYAPFAVLDDIGVREDTEGFRGDLHALINYRVTNGLPTVYTSNIPISELSAVFDERLADRIRDMCVEISFAGTSKRGIRRNIEKTGA